MKPFLADITVNGTVITAARIAAEAQNHPAPKAKPGFAWKAAARALALRELMLQEARARGLSPDPREVAPGQWETDEEALIRQLLDVAVEPVPVSEEAVRGAYDAAPDRFRSPPLYEVAHILIAAAHGEDRSGARAAAGAILAEALAHPARFDALATEHSACGSRLAGGRLGQVGPGDTIPEFAAALAGMAVGELAPALVETRHGFHVVRLDARAEGAVLPFAAVAPRLRASAEKAAWVRAARAFTEALASRAEVTGVALGPA